MSEAKMQIALLIVRQGALSSMQDPVRWNYESNEIHVSDKLCLAILEIFFYGGRQVCCTAKSEDC